MAHEKKGFRGLLEKAFSKREEAPPATGPRDIKADKPVYTAQTGREDLPILRIKFKGICDWDRIYNMMARWFKERKFEFHERLYKAKSPELTIDWFAERKKTGYLMERVDVNFHAFEVEEVEVIKRGQKRKMLKMQTTITFKIAILTGYPDIFGGKKWNTEFLRRLMDFYNRSIIKKEMGVIHTDDLYYEVYKLHQMMKEQLEMEGRGYTYS